MTQARRLPEGEAVSCEVWGALRTASRLKAGCGCVGAENSRGAGRIKSKARRKVKNGGWTAGHNLNRPASDGVDSVVAESVAASVAASGAAACAGAGAAG